MDTSITAPGNSAAIEVPQVFDQQMDTSFTVPGNSDAMEIPQVFYQKMVTSVPVPVDYSAVDEREIISELDHLTLHKIIMLPTKYRQALNDAQEYA